MNIDLTSRQKYFPEPSAFDSYAYAFPSLNEGKYKKDTKYQFDNFFVPKNQNKEKKKKIASNF